MSRLPHNPFAVTRKQVATSTSRPNFSGDRIFKPDVTGVELWQADYALLETVVRPFPAPDPDDPTRFLPAFDPATGEPSTGWVCEFPALIKLGRSYLTVIIDSGGRSHEELKVESPAWLLYTAMKRADDQLARGKRIPHSEGWQLLLRRTKKGVALAAPGRIALVQGSVMRGGRGPFVKGQDGAENRSLTVDDVAGDPPRGGCPGDPSVVFMFPNTAKDAFFKKTIKEPEFDDPVDLQSGVFAHVFKTGFDPRQVVRTAPAPAGARRPQFGQARQQPQRHTPQQGQAVSIYDVFLSQRLDPADPNSTSADLSAYAEFVRGQWRPWEDIIWFPSDEELAHLIARLSGPASFNYQNEVPEIPLSAFEYAWGDFPEWIPSDVRRASARAVSSVGGYQPESAQDVTSATATAPAPVAARPSASVFGMPRAPAPPPEAPVSAAEGDETTALAAAATEVFGPSELPMPVAQVDTQATSAAVPTRDEARARLEAALARKRLELEARQRLQGPPAAPSAN